MQYKSCSNTVLANIDHLEYDLDICCNGFSHKMYLISLFKLGSCPIFMWSNNIVSCPLLYIKANALLGYRELAVALS